MSTPELSDEEFQSFCKLIYRVAGIRIGESKRILVMNRIRRRLRETGITSFSQYYVHLTSAAGSVEMPKFLDAMTTNETYFYRDMEHYAWFSEEFLPEISEQAGQRKRSRTLRIWSAASSTGEELYSLAIKLMERKAQFANWKLYLLGTDISGAVLASAKQGQYDERAVHLVSPDLRSRFFQFQTQSRHWAVNKEIQDLVHWRCHNLMMPLNEAPFDCVFLKNVLIYFDRASREVVVKHILASLAAGAYLVIGPTEGVHNMLGPLVKVKPWLFRKPV